MLPITYGTAASRAFALRCPRCGEGPLFRNCITMHGDCSHCKLKYERAPGYFLGSTYINYGFIAVTLTAMYMALHFGVEVSNRALTPPLIAYCIVVPVVLFRYARAWWLAMDCYFDPTSFAPEYDVFVSGQRNEERSAEDGPASS